MKQSLAWLVGFTILALAVRAPGQCEVDVGARFPVPGVTGQVHAVAQFDDGRGPALYVGGEFHTAGSSGADNIARWNGSAWEGVGGGVNGRVNALAVFDDGAGPALYAAGWFTEAGGVSASQIARWDGHAWRALALGLDSGSADCLQVFDDDGPGPHRPALYAGGAFTRASEHPAQRVARWDGTSWSTLGNGIGGTSTDRVYAMGVYDEDGAGPAPARLFAGGIFSAAGDIATTGIARWDGAAWSAVGLGVQGGVFALATYDPGSGEELYVGGYFLNAGGEPTSDSITRWNGTRWGRVGNGLYLWVLSMTTMPDPDAAGPLHAALYVGGYITVASGARVNNLGVWDGSRFGEVDGGTNTDVVALGSFDDGTGPRLVAGGAFTEAGNAGASGVALLRDARWRACGEGVSRTVRQIVTFDDGSGQAAYCATSVTLASGWTDQGVVRWNGTGWSDVGLPTSGRFREVDALAALPDEQGIPTLFAAGLFENTLAQQRRIIARWTGHIWVPLGTDQIAFINDLAVFDDGDGPGLYACGSFTAIGEVDALHIARWTGARWTPVGGGMNAEVRAMLVYDDGTGPALYAGGDFTTAGGTSIRHIARWNGMTWTSVGAGLDGNVHTLARLRDGAGGTRLVAASASYHAVQQWNGQTWSDLGSTLGASVGGLLPVDPDGDGPAGEELYATGSVAGTGVSKWNGTSWVGVADAPGASALGLLDPDGSGPRPRELLVGGSFERVQGLYSARFATLRIAGAAPLLQDLPPGIVARPWDSITLTVMHQEPPPLAYQWRHDGVPIAPEDDGTRQTLRIDPVQATDAGVYDVAVSNPCGTTLSTPTMLRVLCPTDWNASLTVDSQDFFDFLVDFFADHADFNHDGRYDARDLFDFLDAFFRGC